MKLTPKLITLLATVFAASTLFAAPPADVQAKVDKRVAQFSGLSKDATVVAAVKAYNAAPPKEAAGMTNDKWKTLNDQSPEVKVFAKNKLATLLASKKTKEVATIFVSGSDGGKVAFLSKTGSWTHKGNAKHENPMVNKAWTGDVELDEGKQLVQFALPVLDGKKPIGSIVVELYVADLK